MLGGDVMRFLSFFRLFFLNNNVFSERSTAHTYVLKTNDRSYSGNTSIIFGPQLFYWCISLYLSITQLIVPHVPFRIWYLSIFIRVGTHTACRFMPLQHTHTHTLHAPTVVAIVVSPHIGITIVCCDTAMFERWFFRHTWRWRINCSFHPIKKMPELLTCSHLNKGDTNVVWICNPCLWLGFI